MYVLRENHDNRPRSPLELKSIYLCISPLRERLVMRNWSLQLQRLKSPDPGEPMAWFQSESRSKCRRRPMSQLRDSQAERGFFLIQPLILFRHSMDWLRPIHIGEGDVLIQFQTTGSNVNLYKNPQKKKTPRNSI